jgi:hypothetical protein
MNKHDILNRLMPLCGDFQIGPDDLYDLFTGKRLNVGTVSRDMLLIRVFEWLPAGDLIEMLGLDESRQILNSSFISRLQPEQLRDQYENIQRMLYGEAGFLSGWGPHKKHKKKSKQGEDR